MSFAELLLVLVALVTFFNTGLQYYTTVTTYPLFSHLAPDNFVPFHKAYERTLPLAIYVPYSLLMVSTLLLAVVRPSSVALGWVLLLLALNGSIMAISLAFAAPVHARLDQRGKDSELLRQLRRYNLPRLLAATTSSVVVFVLLLRTFGS
jgi:hypothetical protein